MTKFAHWIENAAKDLVRTARDMQETARAGRQGYPDETEIRGFAAVIAKHYHRRAREKPGRLYLAIGEDPHEDVAYYLTDDLTAASMWCAGWCLRARPQVKVEDWIVETELSEELYGGNLHYQAGPPYPANDEGYCVSILPIELHHDRLARRPRKAVRSQP